MAPPTLSLQSTGILINTLTGRNEYVKGFFCSVGRPGWLGDTV